MIENREMAEFAKNLWDNYIKYRSKEENMDNVSFYKAEVVANNGGGKLTIVRPFDTQPVDVACPSYMAEAEVGTQVLVLRFGDGNNLMNHFIVDNAARTMLASAIATGSSISFPISIANGGTGATTLAGAQTNLEIPVAGDTTPIMDGTADAGLLETYARADHVHPTDTSRADVAAAATALSAAQSAQSSADAAIADAARANAAAGQAIDSADAASQAAQSAQSSADAAIADAARAYTAANHAEAEAERANTAATNAVNSAHTANTAANNALIGLSTIENVVDIVNWFADHKKLTTDTTVNPNKIYYIYNESTGVLTKVDPEGTENPSEEGWYEMTEAVTEYVTTHVAQSADGLSIIGTADGWRVLVSAGLGNYTAGIYLIDPNGNIAQSTNSTGITFDDSKTFYIGDDDAYIVFNGNGNITIGGTGVSFGNKTLTEVLADLGASLKIIQFGKGNSPTSHSDITSWSETAPAWEEGKYIWMRTSTNGQTYSYTCIQGAEGAPGTPGTSITIESIRYAVSSTESQPSDSSFTYTSVPTVAEGSWLWTRTTYSDGSKVYTKAKQGNSAYNYSLIVSNAAVVRSEDGTYSPSTITLSAKRGQGTNAAPADYAGQFKVETTTNGTTWTKQYPSGSTGTDQASYTYTIPTGIKAIRCSLYLAGGMTTLLDQQVVPILEDGSDAYTIVLTNESHTFAGTTNAAVLNETTTCNVIAYKGATQIPAKIGTITNRPSGMSTSITNNETVNAAFTVTISGTMTAASGGLIVPITVDTNKTFNKVFTFSVAFKGQPGDNGYTPYISNGYWYINGSSTGIKAEGTNGTSLTSVTPYYRIASSKPSKPADNVENPTGWDTTEPTYSSTGDCYITFKMTFSNGSVKWSEVSKSSSYEAAKQAYEAALEAQKKAINYITDITDQGIFVHEESETPVLPNSRGAYGVWIKDTVDIRSDGYSVAEYGETARIGRAAASHIFMDFNSFQMINRNGDEYVVFKDLRAADGSVTESFVGDGAETEFRTRIDTVNVLEVTVNDVVQEEEVDYTWERTGTYSGVAVVTFAEAPQEDAEIRITYTPTPGANYYTFTLGTRTGEEGYGSYAFGAGVEASGFYSVAEGTGTTASGQFGAHAEGIRTVASGQLGAHAEGYETTASGDSGAHAEGDGTVASGQLGAHAEGYATVASGAASHAGGLGTIAASLGQTAIGSYNIEDSAGIYRFIIGNGATDSNRSNALAVTRGGDIEINVYSSEDLYTAIDNLGWMNEVTA